MVPVKGINAVPSSAITPLKVARQPVLILGMHRSGTTLITELLSQLGLFIGHDLNEHAEPACIVETNERILRQAGGSWDHPAAIDSILESATASELTAKCLADDCRHGTVFHSHSIGKFVGGAAGMLPEPLSKITGVWGFKDPRTTVLLPLWLRLFPEAILVNIVRHGVDVAASLRTREQLRLARKLKKAQEAARPWRRKGSVHKRAFTGSARCLTLDGAFGLWEEYLDRAEHHLETARHTNPNARQYSVRYEDLLANPTEHLPTLARHCELAPTPEQFNTAIGSIQQSRAFAYANNPELLDFSHTVSDRPSLRRHHYDQAAPAARSGTELLAVGEHI